MAQSATMGPPLSPRETRRSGRRSAPSISASTSKSPDSDQPPREKVGTSRSAVSSANHRHKKLKQEEHDDLVDNHKHTNSTTSSNSNNGNNSSKGKRKAKDKEGDKSLNNASSADAEITSVEDQLHDGQDEEEEQGITRCVCGSTEDDPDAGEFMVQCETCKVWQHGLCMGYISEDQVHDEEYYCELCKPEMHEDLLKRLARKPRQTSTTSRHDPATKEHVSHSGSPPHHPSKQHSKRRNTMNSRDAAADESIKALMEQTAAEAGVSHDASAEDTTISVPDMNDIGKKKRKRSEDDSSLKKRTRSASTASDDQRGTSTVLNAPPCEKVISASKSSGPRNKRGGRKNAAVEATPADSEEAFNPTSKRSAHISRAKGSNAPKRPPLSQSISHGSGAAPHDHGTRRNQSGPGGGQGTNAADARAYRNSHAYAVSQQTLFTSWNLPDYLSHLEQMLPTDVPQPLEVRAGATAASRGESVERTMERGVKVKWPAKRMSVGDMNKRVRALVEWVGREQASALDRGRRREALEKALREQAATEPNGHSDVPSAATDADVSMLIEDNPSGEPTNGTNIESKLMSESTLEMSSHTMKMMEELMEELIGFQERFGPGAKTRERERRLAA